MPSPLDALDRAHAAATRLRALRLLVVPVRVLLAVAFVPSGLTKVLGRSFTRLDPDTDPVGRMFHALEHDMGALYPFVGGCQLVAAVLLLVPRTALLGALVHLPITAGIVVLTTSIWFPGTWLIAWLMLLGVLFLLAWDWPRVRPVVDRRSPPVPAAGTPAG